jgi:hypothetical protein
MLRHKNAKGFFILNGLTDAFGITTGLTASGAVAGTGSDLDAPMFKRCYKFDGSDDIMYSDSDDLLDLFVGGGTVACWFNITADTSTGQMLVSRRNGGGVQHVWRFLCSRTDATNWKLQFTANGSTDGTWRSDSNQFVIGTWYHAAVTYNISSTSNDPILYVNGSAVASSETSTPVTINSDSSGGRTAVGCLPSLANDFYGRMNSVYFHTSILSPQDIMRLYLNLHPIGAL